MKELTRAPITARRLRRCALALALGCLPMTEGVAAAADTPGSADDCVSFDSELGDKRVDVHVQNSCDVKLSCNLRYTVRCFATDGTQTSRAAKQEAFRLGRKGKHALALSAESCKQSWDIDEVVWECS